MQKMIAFDQDKKIHILKLGCTLPNTANICLHKSTDAIFYPFTEWDKNLLEKLRGDVVGGSYIVFTRKAVVDETFIRKSANICKSIGGIDASQLCPNSMRQPMPTCFYTRWGFNSETSRLTPWQNKTRSFEKKGLVLLPTNKTRMWNWKLHYNRKTEINWLFECWWVLYSLQHCSWSHWLLLPLLFLSRAASVSHWKGYSTS